MMFMDKEQIFRYPSPPIFTFFITQRATELLIVPKLERECLAGRGLNLSLS